MAVLVVLGIWLVSTHSRPKAAGLLFLGALWQKAVSTHSRPKAAGRNSGQPTASIVSFNTQPPEGGWQVAVYEQAQVIVSTHSRPKAAGATATDNESDIMFQHTAARRRLAALDPPSKCLNGFNTQPPEGGWLRFRLQFLRVGGFNTQPPEGGWISSHTLPISM